jgi:hypothetical protein
LAAEPGAPEKTQLGDDDGEYAFAVKQIATGRLAQAVGKYAEHAPMATACGKDRWIGGSDRVRMAQVGDAGSWPEGFGVAPLTCSQCGFVRFENLAYEQVKVM